MKEQGERQHYNEAFHHRGAVSLFFFSPLLIIRSP